MRTPAHLDKICTNFSLGSRTNMPSTQYQMRVTDNEIPYQHFQEFATRLHFEVPVKLSMLPPHQKTNMKSGEWRADRREETGKWKERERSDRLVETEQAFEASSFCHLKQYVGDIVHKHVCVNAQCMRSCICPKTIFPKRSLLRTQCAMK